MQISLKQLKNLVLSEVKKQRNATKTKPDFKVDVKEVEAGDYADTLVKHIDFLEKLGIKESKLQEELQAVKEQQKLVRKKIVKI